MAAQDFERNTRYFVYPMGSQSDLSVSRRKTFTFNKVGILQGILLSIKGNIAGTLTAPHPLGKARIVREVRVSVNTTGEIHRFSGAGYHYLIRDHIEDGRDPVPFSDARSAIAAANYNVSMFVPLAVNSHDQPGLVLLSTEETVLTLEVEIEADANIATGITGHTVTIAPTALMFKTPRRLEDYPQLNLIHSFKEEQKSVSTTGEDKVPFPLGDAYLQMLLGYGIGVSGSDKWSNLDVFVGSDRLERWTPETQDIVFSKVHGRARLPGVISLDWLGSSGLESYGSMRDGISSGALTDFQAFITYSAQPDTLFQIRRTLIQLAP